MIGILACGALLNFKTHAAAGEDLSQMLPRLKPLAPEEALKAFRVEQGFHVDLIAAEPDVTDPVAVAWDEDGRLYVCELWNYPGHPKPKEPLGRVRLLESTKGDGVYDKSTIFADNVLWPSGVMPWDGGVFVISSPDIWYFKDTKGSGKADSRTKVLSGFRGKTYEVANNLQWNLDNKIYVCGSYAGGSMRPADHPDAKSADGRDFRFDPRAVLTGANCETVSGGGEWGNTFDDYGNRFTCDATNLAYHAVLPRDALARNPFLAVAQMQENCAGQWAKVFPISAPEPWKTTRQKLWSRWKNTTPDMRAGRFPDVELAPQGFATSAAGLCVYRGSAFPPAYKGSAFIGEPANNVVVRLELKPDGVGFKASRPDAERKVEFLASTDNWFRPVNFANGPDGCLTVVSMYREVIEDDGAIPSDILKHLDLYSGRERGRIYRVAPDGFKMGAFPRLSKASVAELVQTLAHPDAWWRETAQRLLFQKQDQSAVEALKKLAQESQQPVVKIHALWTLNGLRALDEQTLLAALNDADAHVREHALLLSEGSLHGSELLRTEVVSAAADSEPRVRLQAAFTLALVPGAAALGALAGIAWRDAGDKWMRYAIAIAASERAGLLIDVILIDKDFVEKPGASELLALLTQACGARNDAPEIRSILNTIAVRARPAQLQRQMLSDLATGLGKGGSSIDAHLTRNDAETSALKASLRIFFDTATSVALDATKTDAERINGIQLLAFAPYDSASKPLLELLHPSQAPALHLAAVRALSAHADADVPRALLSRWRDSSPAVRQEVLDALFRRAERLPALLDAIEAQQVPLAELALERRNALLKHTDAQIRQRAAKLLPAQNSGAKSELIARYQKESAGLTGDSARGAQLFQATCAACHKPPQGERAGPNLATLEDRSPFTLLVAILDPNRDVKPSFISYTLLTLDGLSLTGVVVNETSTSVTLRSSGGKEESVLRKNIKRLASSGLSLMPEGLEAAINPQQMADLLRYLSEMK